MKITMACDFCGKAFIKESCCITRHNFCSRQCLADFSSKKKNPEHFAELADHTAVSERFSRMNKVWNATRMTPDTREKLREARLGTGEGKSYSKLFGIPEHRVVAEAILGRQLMKGEVVHHLDANKRNNDPSNLMVFASQADHVKYHTLLNEFFMTGRIVPHSLKEVMPL